MIDVSWCVSADHGGIPQFRLCNDEGLVSAVTTPDKPPSLADLEALEQCFQRGLLRCDDVDGNDCSQVEVCGEYAADWGACAEPGKYLHCRDEQKTEGKYWACVNTQETCDHGKMARYKLRIPSDFPASTHTILSYRWDTYENNEVFVGCADIAITGDGDSAPVKPRPTPRPTKGDVATPIRPRRVARLRWRVTLLFSLSPPVPFPSHDVVSALALACLCLFYVKKLFSRCVRGLSGDYASV